MEQKAFDSVVAAVRAKMPAYIQTLSDLVSIPSISFDNFDQKYVLDSAEKVKELFLQAGLTNVQFLLPPSGRPSVYGESLTSPDKPTVLLYAHHDVQPPMREALWNTKPFEACKQGDRLYGRGTADDKAGIVVHLAALEQVRALKKNEGPNLKFLIEGEEESGSAGFAEILKKNSELLKCDAVIVADLENFAKGIPSITTTLRGMSAVNVELKATKAPLHSGSWSGPIPDPGQVLCRMITSLREHRHPAFRRRHRTAYARRTGIVPQSRLQRKDVPQRERRSRQSKPHRP